MPDYDPYDENPSQGGNTGTIDQPAGNDPNNPTAGPPYQSIEWWQQHGKTSDDIFDTTSGQLKPGWSRTALGYEYSAPAASPAPIGGGGAPAAPGGSLIAPFNTPPPQTPGAGTDYIPGTPQFKGPPISKPDPFRAPSVEEALNDPGFKFRLGQGEDALQNWAAARGTLNDSGTAKALIDYGQGAASQEYGNVWDRAYNAYNTNNITQNVQPWSQAFQNATSQNANDITGYTTKSAANQYQTNADYLDRYNQWLSQFDIFKDQRDSTFDKQYKLLTS